MRAQHPSGGTSGLRKGGGSRACASPSLLLSIALLAGGRGTRAPLRRRQLPTSSGLNNHTGACYLAVKSFYFK